MADISKAFDRVCEKFGITELNKYQKEAILQIVQRKTDVFINLPTGFGKSLIMRDKRTPKDVCGEATLLQELTLTVEQKKLKQKMILLASGHMYYQEVKKYKW